jgi:hypothetical protein
MTTHPRTSAALLAAGLLLTGCAHHMNSTDPLKAALDRVPLPAGAHLTGEHADEAHDAAAAQVSRDYTLPHTTEPTCTRIYQAVTAAGYTMYDTHAKPLDPANCNTQPSGTGVTNTPPGLGSGSIRPPDAHTGQISVSWNGDTFNLLLGQGDLPH